MDWRALESAVLSVDPSLHSSALSVSWDGALLLLEHSARIEARMWAAQLLYRLAAGGAPEPPPALGALVHAMAVPVQQRDPVFDRLCMAVAKLLARAPDSAPHRCANVLSALPDERRERFLLFVAEEGGNAVGPLSAAVCAWLEARPTVPLSLCRAWFQVGMAASPALVQRLVGCLDASFDDVCTCLAALRTGPRCPPLIERLLAECPSTRASFCALLGAMLVRFGGPPLLWDRALQLAVIVPMDELVAAVAAAPPSEAALDVLMGLHHVKPKLLLRALEGYDAHVVLSCVVACVARRDSSLQRVQNGLRAALSVQLPPQGLEHVLEALVARPDLAGRAAALAVRFYARSLGLAIRRRRPEWLLALVAKEAACHKALQKCLRAHPDAVDGGALLSLFSATGALTLVPALCCTPVPPDTLLRLLQTVARSDFELYLRCFAVTPPDALLSVAPIVLEHLWTLPTLRCCAALEVFLANLDERVRGEWAIAAQLAKMFRAQPSAAPLMCFAHLVQCQVREAHSSCTFVFSSQAVPSARTRNCGSTRTRCSYQWRRHWIPLRIRTRAQHCSVWCCSHVFTSRSWFWRTALLQ